MRKQKPRTIVITGGTKGIGAAIAKAFYAQGDFVVLISRQDNGFAKALGPRAVFIKGDVSKLKQMHAAMAKAVKGRCGIDVLINCAGHSKWKSIEAMDEQFLDAMIDGNLKGVFYATQAALKYAAPMMSIVNMASLAGKRGSANNSAYCAAKFGVIGLTQSLAKELGPRGIRVNALCPVYVLTEGVLKALKEKPSPAQGKNVQKYLKDFTLSQTALKRLPLADEVASACVFLASPAALAITGQSINIDCGVLPQ